MLNAIKLVLGRLRSDIAQQNLTEEQVGVGLRLLLGNSRLQPGDHVQRLKQVLIEPVPVRRDFLLHRQGNPEIRRLPHGHPEESGRSYADDGVRSWPDCDCLTGNRRISGEAIPPPGIAGYSYGMRSWRLVVRAGEHTPKHRIHAERVEVSTGN